MAQIGKAATRDARSVRPGAAQMTQFLESLAESSNVAASARAAGVRGVAGDWSVVNARVVRTRFGFGRDGGWRHEVVVRCRCMVA